MDNCANDIKPSTAVIMKWRRYWYHCELFHDPKNSNNCDHKRPVLHLFVGFLNQAIDAFFKFTHKYNENTNFWNREISIQAEPLVAVIACRLNVALWWYKFKTSFFHRSLYPHKYRTSSPMHYTSLHSLFYNVGIVKCVGEKSLQTIVLTLGLNGYRPSHLHL